MSSLGLGGLLAGPSILRLPAVLRNLTLSDLIVENNCATASRVLAGNQHAISNVSETYGHLPALPFMDVYSLLKDCASTPPDVSNVTYGQAIEWFIYQNKSDPNGTLSLLEDLRDSESKECHIAFCNNLQWEGNPDLSGIGVYIVYLLQIAVTVVFLLAHIGFYIQDRLYSRRHPERAGKPPPSTIRKAVDQCLEAFWISTYIFTFALDIASLSLNVVNRGPGSVYSGYVSFLGVLISVASLICLYPWFPGRRKYPLLTFASISILFVFMAITSFIFFTLEHQLSYFEEFCLKKDCRSTHHIEHLLRVTPWVVAGITACWGIIASVIHTLGGLLVTASFGVMCTALFYFIHLRARTAGLAGPSYSENEWGFGQILALVAMMPLFVQFFAICLANILERYRSQHPKWHKLVSPTDQSVKRRTWPIRSPSESSDMFAIMKRPTLPTVDEKLEEDHERDIAPELRTIQQMNVMYMGDDKLGAMMYGRDMA
ncbi:hypothetical protein QBC32DRAFT_374397 [Pseudoneurospora amorphoporcata]|uniref:Uncharacterized protein n=1 Tax=Pseudoneurospora amorphoporcata TaxID=241081 RepID=A0AAN6SAR0_9PEZI|nr:hypothetical protein QBC32DRAFT_374397 [Pseudoneurospora amorphoporcata]